MSDSVHKDLELQQLLAFSAELDQLKSVYRQSELINGSRHENSAEHSWHLAVMALLFIPKLAPEADLLRVIELCLLHDLVEIYAGDTYAYDEEAVARQAQSEELAAQKLFSQLPQAEAEKFKAVWLEFEAQETYEAKLARALDTLQPLLLHYYGNSESWQQNQVSYEQVYKRQAALKETLPDLWDFVAEFLLEAKRAGELL